MTGAACRRRCWAGWRGLRPTWEPRWVRPAGGKGGLLSPWVERGCWLGGQVVPLEAVRPRAACVLHSPVSVCQQAVVHFESRLCLVGCFCNPCTAPALPLLPRRVLRGPQPVQDHGAAHHLGPAALLPAHPAGRLRGGRPGLCLLPVPHLPGRGRGSLREGGVRLADG